MLSRLRSNLLRRIGGGVRMRSADGVVLGAFVLLVVNVPFLMAQYQIVKNPAGFPYVDADVLDGYARLTATVIMPIEFGFLLAGLVARKYWPNSQLLAYALVIATGVYIGYTAYLAGPFSDLSAAAFMFAAAVFGLFLVEAQIVRAGAITYLLFILAATVAEQMGAIPYAPYFKGIARVDGQLITAHLFGLGGLVFLILMSTIFFVIAMVQRLQRATVLIRRYVPDQLAEKILSGEHTATSQPERRKLTMFFSDVVGFTEASDQMEAEDLLSLLNEYIREMSAIADEFGATIDSFVGDGIMIFFGAPEKTNDKDHAVRAVRMALAMQHRMGELRDKWLKEGVHHPFEIRIGIHSGMASVGDFGSEGRTTYSAIGTQVNLTARIQTQCEPGHVLVSHTTWALVQDEIPCEERGEVDLKGLRHPVRIYEVMDTASPHYRRVKDRD